MPLSGLLSAGNFYVALTGVGLYMLGAFDAGVADWYELRAGIETEILEYARRCEAAGLTPGDVTVVFADEIAHLRYFFHREAALLLGGALAVGIGGPQWWSQART